jgi:hypothetical protein
MPMHYLHVTNPVLFAPTESVADIFVCEIGGRPGESELRRIVECVGIYDGVQVTVDFAGDKWDDPATLAYMKHGGCRAKLVLGNQRSVIDDYLERRITIRSPCTAMLSTKRAAALPHGNLH